MGAILHPGAVLTSASGRAKGRIGLFATNADGEIFLLTAKHILFADPSPQIIHAGQSIATRALLAPTAEDAEQRYPPFSETIAAAKLNASAPGVAMEADGHRISELVIDPVEVLGCTVFKALPTGLVVQGTLTAVGASSNLRNRFDGSAQRYDDVLEVRFDGAVAGRPSPGEAGSLVLDGRSRALGLIIAVSDECCLVAPLEPYLRLRELSIYTRRLRRADLEDRDLEVRKAQLRDLRADIRDWGEEILAEPRMFRPAGELALAGD